MTTTRVIQAFQKAFHQFRCQVTSGYRFQSAPKLQAIMYCSKQDMIDRFGEDALTELTNKPYQSDTSDEILERAIEEASAEMAVYLIKYSRLTAANPLLTRVACYISHYYLNEKPVTGSIAKRYDDSISTLRCIAQGDISLGPGVDGAST